MRRAAIFAFAVAVALSCGAVVRHSVGAHKIAAQSGDSPVPPTPTFDGIKFELRNVPANTAIFTRTRKGAAVGIYTGGTVTIDYGDGTVVSSTSSSYTIPKHTYVEGGDYDLIIKGDIKYLTTQLGSSFLAVNNILKNISVGNTSNQFAFGSSLTSASGGGIGRNSVTLEEVALTDNLILLGQYCFAGCSSLRSINIPRSISKIPNYCFQDCSSFSDITIPDNVTALGSYCFKNCYGVTNVVVGSGVTTLGTAPFVGSTNIASVTFTEGRTAIPSLFSGFTSITNVNLPSSTTTLGNSCFSGCIGLTEIDIPSAVTSLGASCFSGCIGLTEIDIPSAVTSLGASCFSGCIGLTEIDIPSAVTSLGASCFQNCYGMTNVVVGSGVTTWGTEPFNGSTNIASVTLTDGLTSIGASAFANLPKISEIDIPSSVRSIGDSAFDGCNATINLYGNTGRTASSGLSTVFGNGVVNCLMSSLADYEFANITPPEKYVIGSQITELKGFANTPTLTWNNLDFSNATFDTIGDYCFQGCTGLTSLDGIPSSVTSLGDYCFQGCTGLTDIDIPSGVTNLNYSCFAGDDIATVTVDANNSTYDSRDDCNAIIQTADNTLVYGCKNTTIPSSVTTLGDRCFSGCTGLTDVTIPSSVTTLGNYCFSDCTGLTDVTIEPGIKNFNASFAGCTNLTSIVIPDSVEVLDSGSLDNLYNLTNIVIGSGITNYVHNSPYPAAYNPLFFGCTNLETVVFREGLTKIPVSIMSDPSGNSIGITNIHTRALYLPSTLTHIEDYAFYYVTIDSITVRAINPPICAYDRSISLRNKNIPVYVPAASIPAYQAATGWSKFTNYQPLPEE